MCNFPFSYIYDCIPPYTKACYKVLYVLHLDGCDENITPKCFKNADLRGCQVGHLILTLVTDRWQIQVQ